MPVYKAPLRDTRFLLNEVFDFPEHYRNLVNGAEATPDMVDAILGECAKLCEEVIAPLYHSGDEEGCHLENGEVRTPKGYKEAYEAYVAGGWQGLSHPVEYGGQGLPMSLGALKQEMMGTANWPFSMYPGLPRRDEHPDAARHRGTEADLPGSAHRGPLGRHHVPHRAAVRHRSRPGEDPRRGQPRR